MHPVPLHSAEQRLRLLQDIALRLTAEMSLRQILTDIAETLRERFDWDYVGCASVDVDAGQVRFEAHASREPLGLPMGHLQAIGNGIIGEVAQSAQTRRVDEVTEHGNYVAWIASTRAELCVPVLHQGELIAVLDAQSRHPSAFGEEDQRTLQMVAELLAGSLAASRQLEAVRQRADVIALLADVSRAMLAEDELDAMLQRMIDELSRCFQLSLCTLCLVDEAGGSDLVLRAFAGQSRYPLVRGAAWRSHTGVTGRAMRTGKRIHVANVRQDPDYIEGNPETQAELVVPIRFRDQVLGLINMESRSSATFIPSNQLAMQAMADQAAGAIRLAMTSRRLKQASAEAAAAAQALERSHGRLERANKRLREMSLRDALTGLGNRRRLDRGLRQLWNDAQRRGAPLALLLLDIDHYKAYNDHYGHAAGDVCLRRVGRALRQAVRSRGVIAARYGGEEFALLVPDCDGERALQLAERLHRWIAALDLPHAASPTAGRITVSIGCASEIPAAPRIAEDLLQRADTALYAAKRSGRNRSAGA